MREDGKPYRAGPPQRTSRKKQAVNLSVEAELLREAKQAGVNLSAVLEEALRQQLKQQRWQEWQETNRAAIEKSNAQLECDGMWYEPKWLRE